jgi:hypothetical protein
MLDGNFDAIKMYMEGRSRRQCYARFFRNADPSLRRGAWSIEEDEVCIDG